MLCPVCKTPLSMTDRAGIEIDFCPTCRGVWLDRGELDKIIERSAAAPTASPWQAPSPQPAPAPRYGDERRHHDERYHGKRKHKSMLSEIFDF